MSPSENGGYVHDPSRFDQSGEPVGRADEFEDEIAAESATDGDADIDANTDANGSTAADEAADGSTAGEDWVDEPVHPEAGDRDFGTRGWLLVGAIFLAFVVAPLSVYLWTPDIGGYRVALITLPLLPALLLAVTAVWATTRP